MQNTMYTTVPLLDHVPCDAISSLEFSICPHSARFVYTTNHFHNAHPPSTTLQH